ncbi:hypothetical protein LWI29_008835 [Acer saccharum]|uniref:Protein kinase domain-containing protein n=1 Tax=Acer saccharum TaxID=4024 RepID=A0AA39T132_ACESA|nr:hypothetical protein LWI29_008835 [Acer saccharum]
MCSCLRILSKYGEKAEEALVMKNGAILLEELITSSDGKYNPFCIFSVKELKKATNNYSHPLNFIKHDAYYILYKGSLQELSISVMKLVGCCLETKIPISVFEYVQCNTLADHVNLLHDHHQYPPHRRQFEPLLWSQRLKIAMGTANALAYLHVGFSRPIVLSNIKLWNILFDKNCYVKLFDFSEAVSIPEGETHKKQEGVLLTGKSSYDEVLDYEDDGYRAGIDLADHKALVMELKHTNNDLLERQNGAGGFAKDSESLKKHIAMASSALHHVRQRNTYPEILLPPWLKARLVGNQAGYLDSSYAAQESGSAVVEIVKDSRLKAHTMVDTAIKAMSSIKEGEDAVNGIRQTLEYTDNQQMTSDSRDGTDKNEAQIPSELITSCVSTMLMIQTCTERQYPPSDVAQIIDSAVSSLHPCCPQNLPIYREIEMCQIMSCCLRMGKNWEKKDDNKEAFIMKNGADLLEQLIASSNGKYNPIHGFSTEELKIATNNYDERNLIKDDFYFHKVYKGFLQDRLVSVMKFDVYSMDSDAYQYCFK